MPILEYLVRNDFEFLDRVGYSTNSQVTRNICFKRLIRRRSASGLITFFRDGTVSYKLKSSQLGFYDDNEQVARRVSLEDLEARIETTFG